MPSYGYDSSGLRAWKQVSGSTTYFLYDGSQPVCELDSAGAVTATNTWGGSLLARRVGSGLAAASVFYTFDPQGNVAQRLDSGSNVLGTYAFDAYGLRTGTDTTTDPYAGFGGGYGYYADAETGFSLLGHRYYDTGTGRFINRDPLGYAGGSDLYAYCGNNPVMGADPSGFCDDGLDDARDANPLNLISPIDAPGMSTDSWTRAGNGTGTIPAAMATTALAGLSIFLNGRNAVMGARSLIGLGMAKFAAWQRENALAFYMRQAEILDVSTAENGAIVYSGPGNRELAEQFADANAGRETLEMTAGGKWLDAENLFNKGSLLSKDQAAQIWSQLSQRFAEGASGNVVGFVEGANPNGIFTTVEWPALLKNSKVVNVLTGGH